MLVKTEIKNQINMCIKFLEKRVINLHFILIMIFLTGTATNAKSQTQSLGKVDFCYSPMWWQSVISMPDDKDKILVGKEGQLLFDYMGKKRGVFRDFAIEIKLDLGKEIEWKHQETHSARIPIVRTLGHASGIEVTQEAFVAAPQIDEVEQSGKTVPRRILLVVSLKNNTNSSITRNVGLAIRSKKLVSYNTSNQTIHLGDSTIISVNVPFNYTQAKSNKKPGLMQSKMVLNPGESRQYVFVVDRNTSGFLSSVTTADAAKLREEACRWWEKAALPYDVVQVPDSGIQEMLESCVRNIWQSRDVVNGKIAYKVGPTCYRSLFVVDGAFLLETATMLGRAKDARDGLEFMLGHQEKDGSFDVINRYYQVPTFTKENGIMLWASLRHAQLSQDKEWLRSIWPDLKRCVDVIRRLRTETMKNPGSLNFGLIPGGYIDGGLDNWRDEKRKPKPEYSNVYWNIIGFKAAIEAAYWLGDNDIAKKWQPEYDEFYATYRKAATRDMRKDSHGNLYVPLMMANARNFPPAKGQWAFCHAVYPGGIFPAGDPLVEGQLSMLKDTKVEGLVFDTGWMKDGLWNYFASFYAHAMLWQGHGREAVKSLYDFANHAAPLRVWREEQKPVGKGNEEVGDMPHNWASAEFIRLAVHLIELDRGDELHLLEGFPQEWAAPGMVTSLNGVLTPFGALHLKLIVAKDGKSAQLKVSKLNGNLPNKIVVHLTGLTGEKKTLLLPIDKDVDMQIPIK
jgi:hypothetical protein